MSGGVFGYSDIHAKNEIFGYDNKFSNIFEDREISELIFDVFDLIHDYDRYASGDTGEDTYLKAKAEFKRKWLKRDDERVKRVIDTAIDEVRKELYKTYDVSQMDLVNDSQVLAKDLVDDEFNPYDEECMRCKHLKLKCEFIPTYCKFESRDEPMKTTDYCDICKGDMCYTCVGDATNPYCVPSHYEQKYESQTERSE